MASTDIDEGIKSVFLGILTNAFLAALKITTGVFGSSYALIADGIESITDMPSSIIVYSGLRIAKRPADVEHPYGHGKAESIAAAIVSFLLILAAIYIAYGSIINIFVDTQTNEVPKWFTLVTLTVVIVSKEYLTRRIGKQGDEIKSSAMKTDALHHRSDMITSVTAFVGISIALIGGKDYASADDWAAFATTFLISYNGIRMLKSALSEIMDTHQSEIETEVRSIALGIEGVEGLGKCYIRKSGFQYLVDLHVKVDPDASVNKGHAISHNIQDVLLGSELNITHVMVHIEPGAEDLSPKKSTKKLK